MFINNYPIVVTYMKTEEFTLSNGLKVLYCPTADKGIISAEVAIDAGSSYEEVIGVPMGTAHFLEHVATNSSNKHMNHLPEFRDYYYLEEWLNISHLTGGEQMMITNNNNAMLKEDFDIFLKAVKGFLTPDLNSDVIKKERAAIMHEYGQKIADVTAIKKQSSLIQLFLGESPLSNPTFVLGNADTISNINIDDLKRFCEANFLSNRVTMFFAGDIPENLEELVENNFGTLPKGNEYQKIKIQKSDKMVTGRHSLELSSSKDYCNVEICFPLPSEIDKDYLETSALINILGNMTFNAVRQKNNLAYTASAFVAPYVRNKFGVIDAKIKNDKETIEKTYKILWDVIEDVINLDIPEYCFRAGIHQFKKHNITTDWGSYRTVIASMIAKEKEGIDNEALRNKSISLTKEDILKVIGTYLPKKDKGNYLELVYLPSKDN